SDRGGDAAEGDVAGGGEGEGGLSDAGVVDFGESEDGDDARRIDGRGRRGRRSSGNSRGSLVEAGCINGAASVAPSAAVRAIDLRGNFECYAPSKLGGINDRVVQILGEKQLRCIGGEGRGRGDDMNANAGIKGDVEFSGLLLVGVGGCGDGNDHVG